MKKTLLTCLTALGLGLTAQTNIANYNFAKSVGAVYTPISGGTKLFPSGTSTSYDNEVSAAISLSSPFNFGGVPITSVYVSSNGFITFGAAPSTTNYTPLSSSITGGTGVVAAFAQDASSSQVVGASPEVSYLDGPNEFVVQYKDHANYYGRSSERLNFQIRLNYATGAIDIIYGSTTNPGAATSGISPQVGIRGNSTTYSTNVNSLLIGNVPSGTTCDWSKAVTGDSNGSAMTFSTSNMNVIIPPGLKYSWTPGTQLPVRTFATTTSITNNSATLNWTAPTGATSYNVQYRTLTSCDWTNFSGNPVSTTSSTLTGLTQNTTYQVRVQAVNGSAQSIYSHIPNLAGTGNGYTATGTFTTIANCTSTVAGLASSNVTPDAATISWTASTVPPSNGYEYYYSTSSTAPLSTTTPSGSVAAGITTVNLTGLQPSTQYYYWIRGNCNATDKGVWSSSANFTTSSLCPTITAPAAGAIDVSLTPTITWTALNGVTGYRLKVGTTSGGSDILNNVDVGNTTSYTFSSTLSNSTKYYYSVTGYTPTTTTPATACSIRNFTTVCSTFAAPFVENFNSGTMPTCWSNSSTDNTGYALWQFTGSQDYGTAGNGTSGTVAFVDASSPYAGVHDVTLRTPLINLAGLTTPLLQFKWFKNHLNGSGTLPSYDNNKLTVDIKTSTGTTWETLFTSTTNSTNWRTENIILPAAYNGQIVMVRFVVDKDVAGNGYFYDNLLLDDVELKNAPSCVGPTNLNYANLTATGVDVTWTAATSTPALGYDVYYSNSNTSPTTATVPQFTGITGTTQHITGTPGMVYVWVRSSCTASNKGSWIGPISFTIPSPPPANDECSNAVLLTVGNTFAQNQLVGDTSSSTNSTSLTAECLFNPTSIGGNVWYKIVVPNSGNITIETDAVSGSLMTDSVLTIFDSCTSSTSIGCDDDSGNGSFSKVSLTGLTPGSTLYASVARYSSSGAGNDGQFLISAYDASLSVTEIKGNDKAIKVYPNPFSDTINISNVADVKSVSVVDVSGKVVKTFAKPETKLQLNELSSGMYMILLNMKDGSRQTIKTIKK